MRWVQLPYLPNTTAATVPRIQAIYHHAQAVCIACAAFASFKPHAMGFVRGRKVTHKLESYLFPTLLALC